MQNIIAATSAILNAFPRTHRMSPTDIILPTIPLTESYALSWTLATLFSNATLALTSVAAQYKPTTTQPLSIALPIVR